MSKLKDVLFWIYFPILCVVAIPAWVVLAVGHPFGWHDRAEAVFDNAFDEEL